MSSFPGCLRSNKHPVNDSLTITMSQEKNGQPKVGDYALQYSLVWKTASLTSSLMILAALDTEL